MKNLKLFEEFVFAKKLKVGDKLLCIKDNHFHLRTESLPRTMKFIKNKKYKIVEVTDKAVKLESDMPPFYDHKGEKTQTEIFTLKKDNHFPYLWDYFEKIN